MPEQILCTHQSPQGFPCPLVAWGRDGRCILHTAQEKGNEATAREFRKSLLDLVDFWVEDVGAGIIDLRNINFPDNPNPIEVGGESIDSLLLDDAKVPGALIIGGLDAQRLSTRRARISLLRVLDSTVEEIDLAQATIRDELIAGGVTALELSMHKCELAGEMKILHSVVERLGAAGLTGGGRLQVSGTAVVEFTLNGAEFDGYIGLERSLVFGSLFAHGVRWIDRLNVYESSITRLDAATGSYGTVRIRETDLGVADFGHTELRERVVVASSSVGALSLGYTEIQADVTIRDIELTEDVPFDEDRLSTGSWYPSLPLLETPPRPAIWSGIPEEQLIELETVVDGVPDSPTPETVLREGYIVRGSLLGVLSLYRATITESGSVTFAGSDNPFPMERVIMLGGIDGDIRFDNPNWLTSDKRKVLLEECLLRRAFIEGDHSEEQMEWWEGFEGNRGPYGHPQVPSIAGWLPPESATPGYVASIYRRLRFVHEHNYAYHGAGDFFVGQMEMRRLGRGFGSGRSNRLKRWASIYTGYHFLSRYGESYWHVAKTAVIAVAVGSVFWLDFEWGAGFQESVSAITEAMQSSLFAFVSYETPGFEGHLLSLLGLFHLAMAALALRRKLARYSSLS